MKSARPLPWVYPSRAALPLGAGGAAPPSSWAGRASLLGGRSGRHQPSGRPPRARAARLATDRAARGVLAVASGGGPAAEPAQGAGGRAEGSRRYVRRGEKVVIKPNCAWDRTPEQAANTDPELVGELVRICLAAGAASVVVADSTCHDPGRSFVRSGIGPAAERAGARALPTRTRAATTDLDLGGTLLGVWPVLRALRKPTA